MLKNSKDDQVKKEEKVEKKEDENIKQIEVLTNNWKRALADYQNLEKRMQQERFETARYASAKVITKILSALDILEQAEKHIKDQGLTLAVKSFHDALLSEGVKKIDVVGKPFDPLKMECVEIIDGDKDDIVVEEVRPGYMLEDRILRVAHVKVSKKSTKKEEETN